MLPSYTYQSGDDSQHVSAWGSNKFGRYVECDRHGRQFVTERSGYNIGTYYDDGGRDAQFTERLACGCVLHCQEYRGEVQRFRAGGERIG